MYSKWSRLAVGAAAMMGWTLSGPVGSAGECSSCSPPVIYCPPVVTPHYVPPTTMPPSVTPPTTTPPTTTTPPADPTQPPVDLPAPGDQGFDPANLADDFASAEGDISLASGLGGADSPMSLAPGMAGDLFGVTGNYFLGYVSENGAVSANDSANLGSSRRFKMGESTSPIPRDRVFFLYNLFRLPYRTEEVASGVEPEGGFPSELDGPGPGSLITDSDGDGEELNTRNFDVNRFTFGMEKTFFDGWMSAELRIPFSRTISSSILAREDEIPGEQSTELENISVAFKSYIYRTQNTGFTGGFILNLPTADDFKFEQEFGDAVDADDNVVQLEHEINVRNQSVHITPFVGLLVVPTERLFVQGFAQLDVPLNGNTTTFIPAIDEAPAGEIQKFKLDDQTLLQLDISAGYWIYLNPEASFITGIAPMVEFHYTSTINDADILIFENTALGTDYLGVLGNTNNRLDIYNVTAASSIRIGQRGYVTLGAVFPLSRGKGNNLYDWEFQFQLNYLFGTNNQLASSPTFN